MCSLLVVAYGLVVWCLWLLVALLFVCCFVMGLLRVDCLLDCLLLYYWLWLRF